MKKVAVILLVCLAAAPAFAFTLNPESRREARLFNDFLKAVYAQRADDPKAFAYLQKALESSPDSKFIKRLLVSEAVANEKAALADPYADFISQGENDAEDWTVYAAYQAKKGNLPEAEKAYEKALATEPDNPRMLYQYVLLLSYTNVDKAAAKLTELAETYPGLAPAAYTEAGNLYLRQKDLKQALSFYEQAIKTDPADPAPRLGRGEVYEKSSQYFLMLHEFEELEKMGYGNAGTYSRMASVFLLVKDLPKAEEYFLKAKADDNGDVPSAYFLALIAEQQGDYSRAVGYLKDSSDYPSSAAKWLQVSFYLKRLNRPEESLKTLDEAYKKFDGNVEIGYFYALALTDAKEYKKASKVFEKILKTNPAYDEARLQYAYTLESLKKYKKMESELERLLEKDPKNAPALNLYAYSLAERGERLPEAQELIARALAVDPEDYSFIDTQAWIYFKMGKAEAAENILAAVPDDVVSINPELAYHWGAIWFEQGNFEQARKYLEMSRGEIKAAETLYKRLPKNVQ